MSGALTTEETMMKLYGYMEFNSETVSKFAINLGGILLFQK